MVTNFNRKNYREGVTWEDLGIDGRIILNDLNRGGGTMWAGFI